MRGRLFKLVFAVATGTLIGVGATALRVDSAPAP